LSVEWRRKQELLEKYNITSQNYDELYGQEQREKYKVASRALKKLLGRHRHPILLCDVGCGTLLYYEYIKTTEYSSRIKWYIGIDLSNGMLLQGLKRRDALVDIVQADAEYLPLRDKSCTLLTSFTVIDLLPNPSSFLNECKRVTKLACIVSSLKKAQKMNYRSIRIGVRIGETDKDNIFYKVVGNT
jgi:ubiquinone/menaquinone biosynthesis C-methylase UbiE